MRALGFCVSVKHAEFMALRFKSRLGFRRQWSMARHRRLTESVRSDQTFSDGASTWCFSADVFNEGVDIPEVDTIPMLRAD